MNEQELKDILHDLMGQRPKVKPSHLLAFYLYDFELSSEELDRLIDNLNNVLDKAQAGSVNIYGLEVDTKEVDFYVEVEQDKSEDTLQLISDFLINDTRLTNVKSRLQHLIEDEFNTDYTAIVGEGTPSIEDDRDIEPPIPENLPKDSVGCVPLLLSIVPIGGIYAFMF